MKTNKNLTVFLKNKCINSQGQKVEQTQPEPNIGDGVMIFSLSKTNAHFRLEKIEKTPGGTDLELLPISTLAAYVIEHVKDKECYIITQEEENKDEFVLLEPDFP